MEQQKIAVEKFSCYYGLGFGSRLWGPCFKRMVHGSLSYLELFIEVLPLSYKKALHLTTAE